MPQRVPLPDGNVGVFPDGMSKETIAAVLRKQFPPTGAKSQPSVPNGTISAYKPDIPQRLEDLRQRLSEFAARGVGTGVGDYMTSWLQGPLKSVKGVTELPKGDIWKGAKHIVGGVADTATIPGSFIAPETSVGKAAPVEVRAAAKVIT